ncbi:hypothetical protein Bca4012_059079 [Brassica carinata]
MVYTRRSQQHTDNYTPATQQSITEIQAQITTLVTTVTNLIKQRAAPEICHGLEEHDDINDELNDLEYDNDNFFTSHIYSPIYDRYDTDDDDDDKEEHTSKDNFTNWNGDPIYDESDDENVDLAQAEFAPIFLDSTFKINENEVLKADLEKQSTILKADLEKQIINYALWKKDELIVLPCYGTVRVLNYEKQVKLFFSCHYGQRKRKPPDPLQSKSLFLFTGLHGRGTDVDMVKKPVDMSLVGLVLLELVHLMDCTITCRNY